METRRRPQVLLVVLLAVAAFSACGNPVSTVGVAPPKTAAAKVVVASQKMRAAQRRNLVVSNQVRARNRARLVAAIRLRWQQHAVLVRAAQRRLRVANQSREVVRVFVSSTPVAYSSIDVCTARHGRRQILYYLNLSCPSR